MCILINIQGGFLQQPLFTESCHPPAAKHVIIHKTPGVAEFLHKHNFNPLSLSHSFSAFHIIYQFKQTSAIFLSNSLRWHVVCNQLPVKYYRSAAKKKVALPGGIKVSLKNFPSPQDILSCRKPRQYIFHIPP